MTTTYDIAGDGASSPYDAVLLVHAGVADRRMWEPQWGPFSERHRTIRVDLPGYGDGALSPGEFSYPQYLRDVLTEAGVTGEIAVVAASFGGRVALELAATDPARVSSLMTLCAPAPGYEETSDIEVFDSNEEALLIAGDVDGATTLNVQNWLGPDADAPTAELLRTMQRRAFDVQLASDDWPEPPKPVWAEWNPADITARTVLFTGAHDSPFFRNVAHDLDSKIPRATHFELDWAGHLPTLERPAEMTQRLLELLG